MKRPRIRMRTLVILVAAVALLLGLLASESRRRKARALRATAVICAKNETYWNEQTEAMLQLEAEELAGGRPQSAAIYAAQAAYDRDHAAYYRMQRLRYEKAAREPSRTIGSGPPAPRPFPRDYLSKVPYYVPESESRQ